MKYLIKFLAFAIMFIQVYSLPAMNIDQMNRNALLNKLNDLNVNDLNKLKEQAMNLIGKNPDLVKSILNKNSNNLQNKLLTNLGSSLLENAISSKSQSETNDNNLIKNKFFNNFNNINQIQNLLPSADNFNLNDVSNILNNLNNLGNLAETIGNNLQSNNAPVPLSGQDLLNSFIQSFLAPNNTFLSQEAKEIFQSNLNQLIQSYQLNNASIPVSEIEKLLINLVKNATNNNDLIVNNLKPLLQYLFNNRTSLNQKELVDLLNNLFQLNFTNINENLNQLSNFIQNNTHLADLLLQVLNEPSVSAYLNTPYLEQLFNKLTKNNTVPLDQITIYDYINILLYYFNQTELTDIQLKHLQVFIPDLIAKLSNVNSLEEAWSVLEPIIMYHVNIYLNTPSIFDELTSELEKEYQKLIADLLAQNPMINQLFNLPQFQALMLKITLNGFDTVKPSEFINLFLVLNNQAELSDLASLHIDKYLPDLLFKLTSVNSIEEAWPILEPVILYHLNIVFDIIKNASANDIQYQTNNEFDSLISQIINNPLLKALMSLKEFQNLVNKFLTTGFEDLLVTDFIDLALVLNNQSRLSNETKEHINKYIPDLIYKLAGASNFDEAWSILEPVIIYHISALQGNTSLIDQINKELEPYIEQLANQLISDPAIQTLVNAPPVKNLIDKLVNSNYDLKTILPSDLIDVFLYALDEPQLNDIQRKHLNELIPDLLNKLMNANSQEEMLSLLENVILQHLNFILSSMGIQLDSLNMNNIFNLINNELNNTLVQIFNMPEVSSILNMTEVQNILSKFMQVYSQTNNFETALMSVMDDITNLTMKISVDQSKVIIQTLSPDIYTYAKQSEDPKVLAAYLIHASENVLHKRLREMGIPIDQVQLSETTTTSTTTTTRASITTTKRSIDQQLLEILSLLEDESDDNLFNIIGGGNNNARPVPEKLTTQYAIEYE